MKWREFAHWITLILTVTAMTKVFASGEQFASLQKNMPNCNIFLDAAAPKNVFFNMPSKYLPLVMTLPNPFANIPENPDARRSEDGKQFSIQCKNNGIYVAKPLNHERVLHSFADLVDSDVANFILHAMDNPEIEAKTPLKRLISMFEDLGNRENPERRQKINNIATKLRREIDNPPLEFKGNPAAQLEIEGVWIAGVFHPYQEAKTAAAIAFEALAKQLYQVSAVDSGDYLYRAPDQGEWLDIVKHGYFTVREETNFEREIGPQVSLYAVEAGYAGVVIRILVPGPYYRHAGFQVPRITSVLPHYAMVEVLDGDTWLSLQEYRRKHNI